MNQSDFMRAALEEGKKGLGLVHPNPPVGCVIVNKGGQIVGRGAHLEFGGPHAEINALNSVVNREDLEACTFYVTLEPCAHVGKTPSCAKTLSELPIEKVVYAVQDPNPQVSGQGAEMLRAAGKQVEIIEDEKLRKECEELAEIFLWNMKHKSPFVALKAGTSRNGSLVPDGEGQWVTGEESRSHVQFLRSQYDAVLVGVETFLADNPSLNIRMGGFSVRENYAVVLDPNGRGQRSIESSNLSKVRSADKIIWVTKESVPYSGGEFDLNELLQFLWGKDIHSIFVEGGAKTFGSFLNAGLVNRVYHYSSSNVVSEENKLYWLAYANRELNALGPVTNIELGADKFESFLLRV